MAAALHARVLTSRWMTPVMLRMEFGGGTLADLSMPAATDAYINVAIPPPDAPYEDVFDPAQVRAEHPREVWPARRRYTVRRWDPRARRLTVDVVVHGDEGVAGPWAASARPGTALVFEGPSGGYRPDPDADWHLLVGDESAVPAIAASLEVLPPGVPAVVRLVCDGPDHELELQSPGDLDVVWRHRAGRRDDDDLLPGAVRELVFPPGRVHAFVHGEADEIRVLRRHLLVERGLERAAMSCSPYWRRRMSDEAWRRIKKDFVAAMEAEAV